MSKMRIEGESHEITNLLDDTAAIHLQRQLEHVTVERIGQLTFLRLIALFKKLLNNITGSKMYRGAVSQNGSWWE